MLARIVWIFFKIDSTKITQLKNRLCKFTLKGNKGNGDDMADNSWRLKILCEPGKKKKSKTKHVNNTFLYNKENNII